MSVREEKRREEKRREERKREERDESVRGGAEEARRADASLLLETFSPQLNQEIVVGHASLCLSADAG